MHTGAEKSLIRVPKVVGMQGNYVETTVTSFVALGGWPKYKIFPSQNIST